MNPLLRLAWIAALAREKLTPGAHRVAAVCAELARDGRVMHSTGSLADLAGVGFNTVARALDLLISSGFLVVLTPATQHKPASFMLARVPTVEESGDARVPKRGESRGAQGPHIERPGSPKSVPRVPTLGDHMESREKQGEGITSADTAMEHDFISQVRRLRGQLIRQGEGIEDEWQQLAMEHGEDVVISALKRCPFPRWPSTVRKLLITAEDGLSFDERIPTSDEVREILGVPTGGPANG